MSAGLDVEAAVEAYRSGALDPAAAARLAAALTDPVTAPALLARLRFEAQLVAVLADDQAHQRALRERLCASGDSARFERRLRSRLPRRRAPARRRMLPVLPVVLGLALLGGLVALLSVPSRPQAAQAPAVSPALVDPGPPVAVAAGRVLLVAGQGVRVDERPLVSGSRIGAGRLTVAEPGLARLRLDDGTGLELSAGSQLILPADPGAGLQLLRGSLEAEVAPQPPERPFQVLTPQARVTVVGTRFSVTAADGSSRVSVHSGRVRVAATHGPDERVLAAGDACQVRADGVIDDPPQQRRLLLFSGEDAAAWTPLRGEWTVVDGVLRGRGDEQQRARIASRASFHDLEIELRLRASGAQAVELQLRGYRVFWTIPGEQLAQWATLRARAVRDALEASIDGRPLVVERSASDVDPFRVAIYARLEPGGQVEIATVVVTTTDQPVEEQAP